MGSAVATAASAPQTVAMPDAAGSRGAAASVDAEGGGSPSSFERLMEPTDTTTSATPTPTAPSTDPRDGAAETVTADHAAPDPGQLLALLSQAAVTATGVAAPATAAAAPGTTGAVAGLALTAGARPSAVGTSAATAGFGAALGAAGALPATTGSAAEAVAPPFGLAAMGDLPGDGPLATAQGRANATSTMATQTAAGSAPGRDGPATMPPGMTVLPAPSADTASAALPPAVADLVTLAVATDAATPTDAANAGDPTPATPAWLGAAAPVSATSHASATSAPPPALAMPADPNAGFDDGLGTHVTWMAAHGVGEARIRINPDHLGTIDLVLNIDGQRISAEFQSTHADVRQALEGGLSRLRDQLAQHGLQLVQAQVGDGGDSRRSPRGDAPPAQGGDAHEPGQAPTATGAPGPQPRRARLLDTYA